MIKIRVSYERPEELQRIKKLLHGHVKPWKEAGAQVSTLLNFRFSRGANPREWKLSIN